MVDGHWCLAHKNPMKLWVVKHAEADRVKLIWYSPSCGCTEEDDGTGLERHPENRAAKEKETG